MKSLAATAESALRSSSIDDEALRRELRLHDDIVARESARYVERSGDFGELDYYVEGDTGGPMVVSAPSGRGKTALLASWVHRRRAEGREDEQVLVRFVGTSLASSSELALMESLMHELRLVHQVEGDWGNRLLGELTRWSSCRESGLDPVGLVRAWEQMLASCGRHSRIVLVIDGLERFSVSRYDLVWLSREVPQTVRVIVSIGDDRSIGEMMRHWLQRAYSVPGPVPRPFDALADRRRLVRAFYEHARRDPGDPSVNVLARCEGMREPLFATMVLSATRDRPSWPGDVEEVRRELGTTSKTAFAAIFDQLEEAASTSAVLRDDAAVTLCGLLANAAGGLPEDILVRAFVMEPGAPVSSSREIRSALRTLVDSVHPFLLRYDDTYRFGHEGLREAAGRCTGGTRGSGASLEVVWHELLARCCESWSEYAGPARRYALAHLVQHQLSSQARETARGTLGRFGYHYWRLRELGRDGIAGIVMDLAGTLQQPVPGAMDAKLTPWQELYWRHSPRLRKWAPSVPPADHLLRLVLSLGPRHPLRQSAEDWLQEAGPPRPWLRAVADLDLTTAAEARFREETANDVLPVDVYPIPGGRRVLATKRDGRVEIIDVRTGFCRRTLVGHTQRVTSIAVLPDGERALSGSQDGTLRIWDLATGACRSTFFAHNYGVLAVALGERGCWAVSTGADRTLAVWDLLAEERWATWNTPEVVNRCHVYDRQIVARTWDEELLHFELVTSGPRMRYRSVETTAGARATCAAWHPSRSLLATLGLDGFVRVHEWHSESEFLEEISRLEVGVVSEGGTICWSLDGRVISCRAGSSGLEKMLFLDRSSMTESDHAWSPPSAISANGRWRVDLEAARVRVRPAEDTPRRAVAS